VIFRTRQTPKNVFSKKHFSEKMTSLKPFYVETNGALNETHVTF